MGIFFFFFFQIFFRITSKFDHFYGVLLYECLVFIANSRIFWGVLQIPSDQIFLGYGADAGSDLCMSKSSEYPLWISSFP